MPPFVTFVLNVLSDATIIGYKEDYKIILACQSNVSGMI